MSMRDAASPATPTAGSIFTKVRRSTPRSRRVFTVLELSLVFIAPFYTAREAGREVNFRPLASEDPLELTQPQPRLYSDLQNVVCGTAEMQARPRSHEGLIELWVMSHL